MTTASMIEVAVGVLMLVAAIVLYRRRAPADGGYGSQGAVILIVIAIILMIHGLGLLEYRPSAMELGQ